MGASGERAPVEVLLGEDNPAEVRLIREALFEPGQLFEYEAELAFALGLVRRRPA